RAAGSARTEEGRAPLRGDASRDGAAPAPGGWGLPVSPWAWLVLPRPRSSASGGRAHRRRMALGHEAEPGVEHVADIDLAGRILAAAAAVRVGNVALVAATDLQPLGAFARHSPIEAVVDFEIIGENERAGAVDNVGEADGVAKHLLRRALQSERVGVHDGAMARDR